MSENGALNPRYSRQVILPGVGQEGQEKLARARVLVVGMGGLGSPVSLYLAAAGVGTLGIADNDTVESSNLHRQIVHDHAMTGQPKVTSAKQRLLKINPDLKLEIFDSGITASNAIRIFSQFDIIVDGSDNFPTRYLVNDAAFLSRKPVIYGSIFQFEGQVSVFHPTGGTPCYRCLFPELPEPGTVPNCAEAGVFGALCGIVGSWQASEAIKWIIGVGEPLTGQMKVLDTLTGRDRIVRLKKDAHCPLCGEESRIHSIQSDNYLFTCAMDTEDTTETLPMEISLEEAAAILKADSPPGLIDVRENHEREFCRIGDGLHIPTGEIQFRWESIPQDQHFLIYCHHGMRSLVVTKFLRERGFTKVQSMQGGIDKWSREIDPSIPRY